MKGEVMMIVAILTIFPNLEYLKKKKKTNPKLFDCCLYLLWSFYFKKVCKIKQWYLAAVQNCYSCVAFIFSGILATTSALLKLAMKLVFGKNHAADSLQLLLNVALLLDGDIQYEVLTRAKCCQMLDEARWPLAWCKGQRATLESSDRQGVQDCGSGAEGSVWLLAAASDVVPVWALCGLIGLYVPGNKGLLLPPSLLVLKFQTCPLNCK